MIKLTPELKQSIKESGAKVHYVSLEQFKDIMAKGKVVEKKDKKVV